MRRWLRIVWNGVALLSLLTALAIGALWVRSYWKRDWSCGTSRAYEMFATSNGGQVTFSRMWTGLPFEPRCVYLSLDSDSTREPWGVSVSRGTLGEVIRVTVPHSLLVLLALAMPAIVVWPHLRARHSTENDACPPAATTCALRLTDVRNAEWRRRRRSGGMGVSPMECVRTFFAQRIHLVPDFDGAKDASTRLMGGKPMPRKKDNAPHAEVITS